MVSNGYHNIEEWRSILFQLVYSCAVLQKYEILFNNFSLENNIYIKEVQTDSVGNSCWIYKVNNIDYYVPNFGYVLLIDSKYGDITEPSANIQFKIYGKLFNVNSDKSEFKNAIKKSLISFMNPNSFKVGLKPNDLDKEIIELMNKISNKLSEEESIESILPDCFPQFFNNKFGKLLTKLEKENFSILNKPNYTIGNLMIRQKRYDEYDWVIYKGVKSNGKRVIITKDKGSIEVFPSSLFSYPDIIKQDDITIIDTYQDTS
jgi:hypothetical protein